MEKQLRKRDIKHNAELYLLKILPLLFMILLFLISASVGSAMHDGGLGSGID